MVDLLVAFRVMPSSAVSIRVLGRLVESCRVTWRTWRVLPSDSPSEPSDCEKKPSHAK